MGISVKLAQPNTRFKERQEGTNRGLKRANHVAEETTWFAQQWRLALSLAHFISLLFSILAAVPRHRYLSVRSNRLAHAFHECTEELNSTFLTRFCKQIFMQS